MATNYFDASHIDGKQLTPDEVGQAIRHKKFGVDVREAMAQGIEYCMRQAQKVDTLETEVDDLKKRVEKLETLPTEVNKINRDIGTINGEITKLNTAVFGDGATAVHTINSNEDNHSQLAEEVKLD